MKMKDQLSGLLPDRLGELRAKFQKASADALLVTTPANVRWLTGFSTPEDGRVLITREEVLLLTDFRYDVQSHDESAVPVVITMDWQSEVLKRTGNGMLAIEADSMTVALKEQLDSRLGEPTISMTEVFRDLRMIKQPFEIALLQEAARITDAAFSHILGFMKPGLRELDVALELSRFMRDHGAEGDSFDIIVAGGHRSAMPHGVASARVLEEGDLVTLDFGANYRGYHADMTRSVALGEPGPRLRGMYAAVLEALLAAREALKPGITGADADAVARGVLARHGLDALFTHSLGHGTGLQIHEEPRLSSKSQTVLEPGMIVTVEPGVYENGFGGLRIEDMCVITDDGHRTMSKSERELIVL